MEYVEINGSGRLHGRVEIQGSKNAVLPILAASILHDGVSRIHRCPKIRDVFDTIQILELLGCRVWWEESTLAVDAAGLSSWEIPQSITSRMRSPILFLGALLGRVGKAGICYPGGCSLGGRPVDIHIEAMRKLGASVEENGSCISANAAEIRGGELTLRYPSVGATENIILAAAAAPGMTVLHNAAMEPEIGELCLFLREKGADIREHPDRTIEIRGGRALSDSEHELAADRIAAGTYLIAAAMTDSRITLDHMPYQHMDSEIAVLRKMGMTIVCTPDGTIADGRGPKHALRFLETAPYPGFPTDLQSPLMTLMTVAEGESRIRENIFTERFKTVRWLRKMGARIELKGNEAIVRGVPNLYGAATEAEELRGGAALLLAGLNAVGKTKIFRCHYIDRGYEDICGKLRGVGADIRRVSI